MRYTRLLIGFFAILLALWVLVGEQLTGASADAVVNAELSTVRAPVAGTLTMQDRALGASVQKGEELATLSDPLADNIRLADLTMERRFEAAALLRLTAEAETTQKRLASLGQRNDAYRIARNAEIEARLNHARTRLSLLDSGSAADTGVSLPLQLERAREEVAVLENALAAAQRGVFLGEGYNDAPWSEQASANISAMAEMLRAGVDETTSRIEALDSRITEARLRGNALQGGPMSATVNGMIWEILAQDGEVVQRGQDVLRLLDCDSALVTASVTENIYNGLRVGDESTFRLSGDGRVLSGTVTRLAGSGAQTIYQNLAIAPSQRHLERYDVSILVPALRDEPELRCAIGRTGRVFFEARPLDWLRNLVR